MKYAFCFLFILISCGQSTGQKSFQLSSTNQRNQGVPLEYNSSECQLSKLGLDNDLGSPQTIEQVIDLINALPKPVTIPCFLQALKRPLRVNTTSSILSVQPAEGSANPRIFIFFNKLIISVAPAGDGKDLMEFSFMYTDLNSLKGELAFPIQSNISYSAPYIKVETGGQSSCSGCHVNEVVDINMSGTTGYMSMALRPDPSKHVSLTSFYQQSYLCNFNNDHSYRCQVIRSLWENGSLMEASFPVSTPTYFESLGF